ncbi:MAG: TetR/AcrR family transcriptional regulator [Bacillota bacterium]|nr:TetR/AcrR family transcriptional regulator [Bacillota bacterium]
MQIQKDDVRCRIVAAATEEFYNKGYRGASLREIAAAADITPGNIYRYFTNKSALYKDVTKPAWDGITALFDKAENTAGNNPDRTTPELAKDIVKVFIDNQKQFIILINDSSFGHQDAKSAIVNLVELRVYDMLCRSFPPNKIDRVLLNILAVAVTEAMICVFLNFNGDEELLYRRTFKVTNHIFGNIKDTLMEDEPKC